MRFESSGSEQQPDNMLASWESTAPWPMLVLAKTSCLPVLHNAAPINGCREAANVRDDDMMLTHLAAYEADIRFQKVLADCDCKFVIDYQHALHKYFQ